MTDDLISRLRTITVADSANIIYKTMAEAAIEIERLRAERDQFHKFWSYAIHERNELFDTAFPTNENYTSFIHPDAKGDL